MQALESTFLYISLVTFFFATLLYAYYLLTQNESSGNLGTITAALGLITLTVTLVIRTIAAGHVPFANMYEFTASFVWGVIAVYLFAEWKYKLKAMGAFVVPVGFILLVIAAMLFQETSQLVPALQSNWLTFHVIMAVVAYGAYALSFGIAIMFILKYNMEHGKSSGVLNVQLPASSVLDEMSYRAIAFAFPFMSLVIITGAIWAEYAWGRYWSWDPKETWSLITWLVYAAYLHARFTYGWRGKRAAWMAIIGFVTVLFTYFGVNMLLSGLHSY